MSSLVREEAIDHQRDRLHGAVVLTNTWSSTALTLFLCAAGATQSAIAETLVERRAQLRDDPQRQQQLSANRRAALSVQRFAALLKTGTVTEVAAKKKWAAVMEQQALIAMQQHGRLQLQQQRAETELQMRGAANPLLVCVNRLAICKEEVMKPEEKQPTPQAPVLPQPISEDLLRQVAGGPIVSPTL